MQANECIELEMKPANMLMTWRNGKVIKKKKHANWDSKAKKHKWYIYVCNGMTKNCLY